MGSGPLSRGFIDRTGPQTGTLMLNVDFIFFFKDLYRVLHITKRNKRKKASKQIFLRSY